MMTAETLCGWLRAAESVVFFGGAGVSTESGIPDFRSAGGIYEQEAGAETLLTPRYMRAHPDVFWDFYRRYFMTEGILPNPAHTVLAEWEADGLPLTIVTQNVDGLHQAAGSRRVLELHGNGHQFYCTACGAPMTEAAVRATAGVPVCPCGGAIRPAITLYEESLDGAVLEAAVRCIQRADLLIVGGTSLTVYPAAGLVDLQARGRRVVINRVPPERRLRADGVVTEPIGAFFEAVGRCWRETATP